jgi:4-alpha-glucanotransferase
MTPFTRWAALLGRRTGSLHAVLARGRRSPDFAPEPLTAAMRAKLARKLERQAADTGALIGKVRNRLPAAQREAVDRLAGLPSRVRPILSALRRTPIAAQITRTHGDYHLGQDWGILPLHPTRIRANGYRYVRQCLENHMRYAGMLRLDHVMMFYRLYWVPRNLGAKKGAYVRYAMDEFFALLCLESHRNRCVLIGEDLGTVPPEIRKAMDRHKILRMYVQQRRLSMDPKEPLNPTPENCISSLNTHDMPPFKAFWDGLDIVDKMKLGYYGRDALPGKMRARAKQKAVVVNWLVKTGRLDRRRAKDVKAILEALLRWTAAGPARVMQINIEDLWQETHFQNVPGTWRERPNWRRKCRYGLAELRNVPGVGALLADLAARRKGPLL